MRRLKRWVKITLAIIVIAMIVEIGILIKKDDDNFMKSCTEAGFSIQHCESHK